MRSEQYDVVVVGAGLGGLAAAARLARGGLKVRLLERHVQPGGYASTFFRDPFEFEISLHELSGIGTPQEPGPLWHKLDALGVARRLTFLPIDHLFRAVAPRQGLDLRLPANREGALQALVEAFPRQRRGLRRVMDHLFQIQAEIAALGALPRRPSVLGTLARFPAVSHAATVPLSALLDRELSDPLARMALGQMWSYFGLPPSRLSLALYAGGVTSYLTHGASYIRGKSQALSNALVQVIEEAGGEVTLGSGAARILLTGGRVSGVLSDHGEQLQAPCVVANANPVTVAMDLVGAEHLPQKFLRRLGVAEPSVSSVCVFLGLSKGPRELGLQDHEVFINNTTDHEQQYAAALRAEPPDSLLLTAYNVADEAFSPPGTSVVVLVALADGRAWSGVSPRDYPALKERYAQVLLQRAAELYPDLPRAVQVAVVSTPLTNMRYTGNVAGAIYGFANTPAENPAFRLEQRGPLPGLWFAGAWTRPGGGFEPTLTSGVSAAEQVLAERGAAAARGSVQAA